MVLRTNIFALFIFLISSLAAWAERRVALVIGNSSYSALPALKNPQNDARDVGAVLSKLGFEVILGTDLTRDGTQSAILQFARALEGADTSLLFYAGHGVQLSDQNHLVPIDAVLSPDQTFDEQTITVDRIVGIMNQFTETSLVFLDACRDNPLTSDIPIGGRDGALGRGLARIRADGGSYIAFATAPGNVAYDGKGRNSPFTTALLRHIETPNIDVRLMMSDVRQDVFEETERLQMPWENSSLIGRFYFNSNDQLERLDKANRTEAEAWQAISASNRKEDYAAFLRDFPDGSFTSLANLKLRSLEEFDQRTDEEREGFLVARAAFSETAWIDFLDAFPDGLFAEIAREELSELRDELDRQKLSLEEIHWRSIRNSKAPADFSTYLLIYPNGAFSDLAEQRLEAAQAAQTISTTLTGDENANEIELEREIKRRVGQIPVQFVQYGLNALGHQVGDVSGVLDRETKIAIRNYQATIEAPQTGRLNAQQTVDLILAAAALGDANAMTAAGIMTASGDGLRQNEEVARLWLDRASDQGNGLAMANLGILYRDGRGGARDVDQARSLLAVAVTLGVEGAEPLLRSLSE
jgi:outer membrane protein assembly factor BamD (BamD/ComL family)